MQFLDVSISVTAIDIPVKICHDLTHFYPILTAAFRVEMQRESQKDRIILCKYDPTEPGDYRIEVKWSGDHVPGSPFNVAIFDTQEELNRYVHVSGAVAQVGEGCLFLEYMGRLETQETVVVFNNRNSGREY